MDNKDDSTTEHIYEQDLDILKHQCKKIFFKFSKIVESLVEEIEEKKRIEKQEES